MKPNQTRQSAGLWVDNNQALVISRHAEENNGEFAVRETVTAEHYHGDKGEHASMNAKPQNLLKYHKEISKILLNYDDILVFGPGKSQEQLVNFLHEDQHFKDKNITIEAAQHMTDHQMIAKVRDHFA